MLCQKTASIFFCTRLILKIFLSKRFSGCYIYEDCKSAQKINVFELLKETKADLTGSFVTVVVGSFRFPRYRVKVPRAENEKRCHFS